MTTSADSGTSTGPQCKLGRVIEKYDLNRLDERIATKHEEDDASLRELERLVNRTILRAAMAEAGMTVIEGDGERYLELLTGDDTLEDAREEARSFLSQIGVDVETVLDDMISYQTVRTHLRQCHDMSTSRDQTTTVRDAEETLGALETKTAKVTERTLSRLRRDNKLKMGEPKAVVTIAIECGTCGRQENLHHLLESGGCPECPTEHQ